MSEIIAWVGIVFGILAGILMFWRAMGAPRSEINLREFDSEGKK